MIGCCLWSLYKPCFQWSLIKSPQALISWLWCNNKIGKIKGSGNGGVGENRWNSSQRQNIRAHGEEIKHSMESCYRRINQRHGGVIRPAQNMQNLTDFQKAYPKGFHSVCHINLTSLTFINERTTLFPFLFIHWTLGSWTQFRWRTNLRTD